MRYQMAAMPKAAPARRRSAAAATSLPEEAIEEIRRYYGFDKPVHIRYAQWLWNVLHLDLGRSYVYQDPVWDVIKSRFPVSIFLGLTGFFLSYLVCVPLGVLKAVRHGSRFDFVSSVVVFLGYAIPGWALGTALLVLFGGGSFWNVFPLGGFRPDNWEYLSLWGKITGAAPPHVPAGALLHGRLVRDADDPDQELADGEPGPGLRAHGVCQGLNERRVIFVHALRNSLIPIVTGLGHVDQPGSGRLVPDRKACSTSTAWATSATPRSCSATTRWRSAFS